MPLPKIETLVSPKKGNQPICCRDPEVKGLLDKLMVLKAQGESVKSADLIAIAITQSGYPISSTSVRSHFRGECGTTED